MELICYVAPDWKPRIRPAEKKRGWMDDSPEAYAYRCLPLNISNTHGWKILSPCGFSASWDGGAGKTAVHIDLAGAEKAPFVPVSLFGSGILTFHVEGLFRTPPGWNLFVGGPPNSPKDGIAPLSGVIETDWSPYTFTMNWKFTRPHHPVRFEENEPICFFFPIERRTVESVDPRIAPMADDPELERQFDAWSASRLAFHREMETNPPSLPAERWQKLYYRGTCPDGARGAPDHQTKLATKPFLGPDGRPLAVPGRAATQPPVEASRPSLTRRGESLMEALEQQRGLSRIASAIHMRIGLESAEFLDQYYAPARPLLLRGEMDDWPALRWTADHVEKAAGAAPVEVERSRLSMAGGNGGARSTALFSDLASAKGQAGAATVTGSTANAALFRQFEADLRVPSKFMDEAAPIAAALCFARESSLIPLHLRVRNLLLAQINGRERVVLLPPSEAVHLYSGDGIFSEVADIESINQDDPRFSAMAKARRFEVELAPGEMLFVPIGWSFQATALAPGLSALFTDFRWPNDPIQPFAP